MQGTLLLENGPWECPCVAMDLTTKFARKTMDRVNIVLGDLGTTHVGVN